MFFYKKLKPPKNSYVTWWHNRVPKKFNDYSADLKFRPLVSIITPTYETQPWLLFKTFRSVTKQHYKNWQWVISDDASTSHFTKLLLRLLSLHRKIQVIFNKKKQHISKTSNVAVKHANGQYLAFLDHDDELAEDALLKMIYSINISMQAEDNIAADFLYSDEDFIDSNGFYDSPHFKTDFNEDLLLSHNYITHLCLVKKTLFDEVGGFRSKYDGAQDYDFILRSTEKALKIRHVSDILYHWRRTEQSTSTSFTHKPYTHERGKQALRQALSRRNIKADVLDGNMPNFFYVKRQLQSLEKVSIIIPFKDRADLLNQCIFSILNNTEYSNFEIIGVSNSSSEKATFDAMEQLSNYKKEVYNVCFYEFNDAFNFSKLVNYGVSKSSGQHIVLMNNDIKILNSGWLEAMLVQSQRHDVAAVGAKLYYPDNTIQHAGIAIGLGKSMDGGSAGHIHQRMNIYTKGYYNRANTIQQISAVTAALLMVKKNVYDELEGFDEIDFAVAFNDVDFCLRAMENGYKNIFTPYATAYHYESISRGHDVEDDKLIRLNVEKEKLRKRHSNWFNNYDPFYNKNLNYDCDDFSV